MAYPVVAIKRSKLLNGRTNGKLPDSILVNIPGLKGGPVIRLIEPAARSWKAMTAHALRDGIVLKASGPMDSFRPYDVQERIFRQRYTTKRVSNKRKVWNGISYYLKPGNATAAVPGTSNHGWGGAVDTGVETDGDPGTESINASAIAWLRKWANSYGWSWELQSEPWHLHYFAGDSIPQKVLDYERGNPAEPEEEDDDMNRQETIDLLRSPEFNYTKRLDGIDTQVKALRRGLREIAAALGVDPDVLEDENLDTPVAT